MKKVILALSMLTLLPGSSLAAPSAQTKATICAVLSVATMAYFVFGKTRSLVSLPLLGASILLISIASHYKQEAEKID